MKSVKIGIIGGAYNPITKGHIILAQKVLNEGLVDQIWLEPCYIHNYGKNMLDPEIRIEMCKIAVTAKGDSRISVSEFEIKSKIIGGTLNYIQNLRAAFSLLFNVFRRKWIAHMNSI